MEPLMNYGLQVAATLLITLIGVLGKTQQVREGRSSSHSASGHGYQSSKW